MKKNLMFIILVAVMLLAGCGKDEQMTNFIPTQAPEEDNDEADITEAEEDTDQDGTSTEEAGDAAPSEDETTVPTQKAVHIGQTTTKYVKLDEYDAILNVRATPSKDGDIVGFLVHTEKVQVIEIKDGWASIKYNDGVCYISSDFLVDERPDYIDPPTMAPTPTKVPEPAAGTTGQEDAPPEI